MTSLRPRSRARRLGAAGLGLTIGLSAGEVWAQQATALDRFDPAPAADPFFGVPSAEVPGRAMVFGGATFSFADAPLVAKGGGRPPSDIVGHQAALHLGAGVELATRLLLDASLATIPAQGGDGSVIAGPPSASATVGDLRVGSRVAVLARDGWQPGAAIAFDAWLPTGDTSAYASAGVVRVAPRLVLGVDRPEAAWSATVASRLVPRAPEGLSESEVEVGAAGGPRFGPLWVGAEVDFRIGLEPGLVGGRQIGGEARLGARAQFGPWRAGLAAGPGLGDGFGTPTFRVIATLGAAFDLREGDDEGDAASRGATPEAAPPRPAAPIERADVACPAAQVKTPSGCAADGDGDGVPDAGDACPVAQGPASLDAARSGCPVTRDADGDGVVDETDACPRERGAATSDPKTTGCPSTVRFEGAQIVILEQVRFETASARLDPASDGVLGAIAQVLADHEEIARLAVDGHTDGKGDARANQVLSQKRALAVVTWLVEHGVDARRLEARGFGSRRPLADDATPEGRAKNRRVELIVRKRTELGKAGWVDGPVD